MNLEKVLNQISDTLLNEGQDCYASASLMSGSAGIALFLAYYHKAFGCRRSKVEALKISNHLLAKPEKSNLRLSDGLCGQLWAVSKVESALEIDLGSKGLLKELHKSLMAHASEFKQSDQLDFLHGLLGVELCFSGQENTQFSSCIDEAIVRHAQKSHKGTFWKESLGEDGIVNLGLAHGQAAHLCYLADRLHDCRDETQKVFKQLLKDGICFFRNVKIADEISQFPSFLANDETPLPSRLAWCYGDLGVGITFLRCGYSLSEESIVNEGVEILKSTTSRKDKSTNGIHDLGFCHGSSGLIQLYDYIHRLTSEKCFYESKEYWLNYTVKKFSKKKHIYRAYRGPDEGWVESLGLLDGMAGIGLVILSQLFPSLSKWEEIFYLKPIRDGKVSTTPPTSDPPAKLTDH